MMQRAMELKKKKNLEPMKGNRFEILQFNDLNQMSCDVNIKVGNNINDKINIINNMISEEEKRCELFARDNPEVVLPVNLDVSSRNTDVNSSDHILHDGLSFKDAIRELDENDFPSLKVFDNRYEMLVITSPTSSIKEPNSSELWTEVVRKGKVKAKTRSSGDKIGINERGILEY
jgi:hypothetical protein